MQSFVRSRRSPALPLYASPVDGYSKHTKARGLLRMNVVVLACLAAAAVALVLVLAWLSTPILKAYKTSRSPDHESEWSFATETGCVLVSPGSTL